MERNQLMSHGSTTKSYDFKISLGDVTNTHAKEFNINYKPKSIISKANQGGNKSNRINSTKQPQTTTATQQNSKFRNTTAFNTVGLNSNNTTITLTGPSQINENVRTSLKMLSNKPNETHSLILHEPQGLANSNSSQHLASIKDSPTNSNKSPLPKISRETDIGYHSNKGNLNKTQNYNKQEAHVLRNTESKKKHLEEENNIVNHNNNHYQNEGMVTQVQMRNNLHYSQNQKQQRNTVGHCASPGQLAHSKNNSISGAETVNNSQISGHPPATPEMSMMNNNINNSSVPRRFNGHSNFGNVNQKQIAGQYPPQSLAKYQFCHVNFDLLPHQNTRIQGGQCNSIRNGKDPENNSEQEQQQYQQQQSRVSNRSSSNNPRLQGGSNPNINHGLTQNNTSNNSHMQSISSEENRKSFSLTPVLQASSVEKKRIEMTPTIAPRKTFEGNQTKLSGDKNLNGVNPIDDNLRNYSFSLTELHRIFGNKIDNAIVTGDTPLKENIMYVLKNYKIFLENTMKIIDSFDTST